MINRNYKTIQSQVYSLNAGIETKYHERNPLTLTVDGRPELHVLRLRPWVAEAYGTFRNKGPHLVGQLALRLLAVGPHPEGGATIVAALEAQQDIYGYEMHDSSVLNWIAAKVGSEARFLPTY